MRLRDATKDLLIINLVLSILSFFAVLIVCILYSISSKDPLILLSFLGLLIPTISIVAVLDSLAKLDRGGSVRLGVILILFSMFFPSGILYIIHSSNRGRKIYSEKPTNKTEAILNQSHVILKFLPPKETVKPYKAIYILEDLFANKMIKENDYLRLLNKYKVIIENNSFANKDEKVDPYKALVKLNEIKPFIKEEDYLRIYQKYSSNIIKY